MQDKKRRFNKAAAEMTSMATLAPFVVGTRMMQFWMGAASPRSSDRREAERMVSEKMAAVGESVLAMNVATANAVMAASVAMMTGARREVDDADDILVAGLLPYSKRVRANRTRLSRRG